jgi:hypothetical protein
MEVQEEGNEQVVVTRYDKQKECRQEIRKMRMEDARLAWDGTAKPQPEDCLLESSESHDLETVHSSASSSETYIRKTWTRKVSKSRNRFLAHRVVKKNFSTEQPCDPGLFQEATWKLHGDPAGTNHVCVHAKRHSLPAQSSKGTTETVSPVSSISLRPRWRDSQTRGNRQCSGLGPEMGQSRHHLHGFNIRYATILDTMTWTETPGCRGCITNDNSLHSTSCTIIWNEYHEAWLLKSRGKNRYGLALQDANQDLSTGLPLANWETKLCIKPLNLMLGGERGGTPTRTCMLLRDVEASKRNNPAVLRFLARYQMQLLIAADPLHHLWPVQIPWQEEPLHHLQPIPTPYTYGVRNRSELQIWEDFIAYKERSLAYRKKRAALGLSYRPICGSAEHTFGFRHQFGFRQPAAEDSIVSTLIQKFNLDLQMESDTYKTQTGTLIPTRATVPVARIKYITKDIPLTAIPAKSTKRLGNLAELITLRENSLRMASWNDYAPQTQPDTSEERSTTLDKATQCPETTTTWKEEYAQTNESGGNGTNLNRGREQGSPIRPLLWLAQNAPPLRPEVQLFPNERDIEGWLRVQDMLDGRPLQPRSPPVDDYVQHGPVPVLPDPQDASGYRTEALGLYFPNWQQRHHYVPEQWGVP